MRFQCRKKWRLGLYHIHLFFVLIVDLSWILPWELKIMFNVLSVLGEWLSEVDDYDSWVAFESIKVKTQSRPNAFPARPKESLIENEDNAHLRDGATVIFHKTDDQD